MRTKRFLSWLMVAGMFASLGCARENEGEVVRSQGPDEVFSDFTTQESDSGKVQWKLRAPKASKYKAKKLIVLEKPTIYFYDEDGQLKTTLTAENGEYYEDNQDMLAYGNVVVVSQKGEVLETDSLMWKDKEEKIISDSFVKLTRGSDVLTGIGLECDYNLSSVDIKRNVEAILVDEGGEMDDVK